MTGLGHSPDPVVDPVALSPGSDSVPRGGDWLFLRLLELGATGLPIVDPLFTQRALVATAGWYPGCLAPGALSALHSGQVPALAHGRGRASALDYSASKGKNLGEHDRFAFRSRPVSVS
jgi:hypothetical protein